jgi:hypothetical protein
VEDVSPSTSLHALVGIRRSNRLVGAENRPFDELLERNVHPLVMP